MAPTNDVSAVLPQNTPTPAPVPSALSAGPAGPAPTVADNSDAQNAAAQSIASVTGPPKSTPVPVPGQNMSVGEPQSKAAKVFQAIAGGQTTDYVQTPNGPVPVKRNLKPGEMARTILASAFSLLSAGTGGDLAAREKRPYEQNPNQTIGGMQQEQNQAKQQEAQKVFENKQQADKATLDAHKAAQEQQESAARIQEYADNHRRADQAYATGELDTQQKQYDFAEKQKEQIATDLKNWRSYMSEPGAEVMKDAKGNPISFFDIGKPGDPGYVSAGQQLQKYMLDNPSLVHGNNNGGKQNQYGVLGAVNPWTGALQLIDLPPDRNDKVLLHVGQAVGADDKLEFDKAGNPVPNTDPSKGPILYDPISHKPTVATDEMSSSQVGDIMTKQLTQANIQAEMADRKSQAKLRDAQADAIPELNDALSIYNSQGVDKLTAKQRSALATMYGREYTLATTHLNQMGSALAKANQMNGNDPTVQAVKDAQSAYDDAKNNYDDAQSKYDELTGLTPGVRLANKIIRTGNVQANWAGINDQIVKSGLPPAEQEAAKTKVWNTMSPAQQATVLGTGGRVQTATPAAAGGAGWPGGHQKGDVVTLKNGNKMKILDFQNGQFIPDPTYKPEAGK